MEEDIFYILTYILIQELFENDLLDVEELKEKYTLTEKTTETLNNIINELYGTEEES